MRRTRHCRFLFVLLCGCCSGSTRTERLFIKLQEEPPVFYWEYSPHGGPAAGVGLRFAMWEDGAALVKVQNSHVYRFGQLAPGDITRVRAFASEVINTKRDPPMIIMGASVVDVFARQGREWKELYMSQWSSIRTETNAPQIINQLTEFDAFALLDEIRIPLKELPRLPGEWWVRGGWDSGWPATISHNKAMEGTAR